MQETWVQSLGWEDPLEEGVATLPGEFPWIKEPEGLQSMRSQNCTRLNDEAQHSIPFILEKCVAQNCQHEKPCFASFLLYF